jgi:hypothetical protein
LNEADARRLLLARAVDEADAPQQLVGAVEREQIERDSLSVAGDPALGLELDAKAYLLERARRLLALVAHRRPRIAALAEPSPPAAALGWALPLLAFAAGAALDRIDNPQQINLLSPPLLAFLFWNVAVYAGLAVLAVRRHRAPLRSPWERLPAWPRAGGLQAQVAARFHAAWWRTAGTLESQRWRRVLHLSAAAWGLGVALSIVLGGLVREYRVGWESTLLDLPQVHAFLRVLFAPVVALTPLQGFSPGDLARLHFGSGVAPGRAEARHWVFLYLALIAIVVLVPRLALAGWAAARQKLAARALRVPLDDAYFTPLLGRVRPARLRFVFIRDERLATVLRQAGGEPAPPDGLEWTVLRTDRGDSLGVLFTSDPAAASPLPAIPAHWQQDPQLQADLVRLVPTWQAPGAQRLFDLWAARAAERLAASCRVLAGELAQAARDVEPVETRAMGMLEQLREGREAARAARERATLVLAGRVTDRRTAGDVRLRQLHQLDGAASAAEADGSPFTSAATGAAVAASHRSVAMGGAASGAALGLAVDAMTGGISLGAAAALGALIGGGSAIVAAQWRDWRGVFGPKESEPAAFSDDVLRTLAQGALVRYLRVAHEGRAQPDEQAWRALAESLLASGRAELDPLWPALRENENAAGAEAALAAWLRASILRALEAPGRSGKSA